MDVEIRCVDNIKGKGLFARRDFNAGTIIFEEDPLVCCQFSWNAAYGYKACDYCLSFQVSANETNNSMHLHKSGYHTSLAQPVINKYVSIPRGKERAPTITTIFIFPSQFYGDAYPNRVQFHLEYAYTVSIQACLQDTLLVKIGCITHRPLETAEENARRLSAKPDLRLPYPQCCTTKKDTIVSCNLCGVNYCNPQCQIAAYNQYHRTLCFQKASSLETYPLYQLNEMWKQMHYPPETSSIMIIPRILATIQQSSNREYVQAQFLQFCHRTINEDSRIAHKFLGEKFAGQISVLHSVLVQGMNPDGISHFLTQDGFQSLIALIGTNGQGVGTSAVSQWVTRSSELQLPPDETVKLDQFIDKLYEDMDKHSGNFLNNEGVALFSLQSSCNHSCVPNAEATYLHNNSRLSLVALTDIKAGDEICISYLDECTLERSRHSRKKELSENYLFNCGCPKCEQQARDPDVTSDEGEEDQEIEEMSE